MRIYKNAIITTGLLTIISFIAAVILYFHTQIDQFWSNALLGVFGSGLLTLLTSIIGYGVERRKTFEGFAYKTKEILHVLNKYQISWGLDEKIVFFLNYHDISKADWDRYYGDFSFIADVQGKNRCYIYTKIYEPILKLNQTINKHVWHFRWYEDGTGKNKVVGKFIKEIETQLIEETVEIAGTEMSNVDGGITMTTTKNKLVCDIQREINGKYYQLMYGKKAYNKGSNI